MSHATFRTATGRLRAALGGPAPASAGEARRYRSMRHLGDAVLRDLALEREPATSAATRLDIIRLSGGPLW